ncbi:MAG: homoserine dehydrogenase [Magnetococcales bacterium]|nr:homoserine dehydrogenase [Magnetococcales bacterium]
MKQLRVGILGCGTVGTGTARLLMAQQNVLRRRTGVDIKLVRIADRIFANDDHGKTFKGVQLVDDAAAVIEAEDIDVVIELIGGLEPARSFVIDAMKRGKHVVTANKALVAVHGNDILLEAIRRKVDFGFEASVAGAVPVIKAVRESLAANTVVEIHGILNGTCNYILTQMREEGLPFDEVLKTAQEKGYAEADPTFDVDGIDTAHKLAILSALAFGTPIVYDKVFIEGIRSISDTDIKWATRMGFKIKLLGITQLSKDGLELRVHPTMVSADSMVGSVEDVFNAVFIKGDFSDTTMYYGRGAGEEPTASAVVADIIDIARNLKANVDGHRVAPFSYLPDELRSCTVRSMDKLTGDYYIRLTVDDRPGVLADITAIFKEEGISIKRLQQEARSTPYNDPVPLVMVTHRTRENQVQGALRKVANLDAVKEKPHLIRIENELA